MFQGSKADPFNYFFLIANTFLDFFVSAVIYSCTGRKQIKNEYSLHGYFCIIGSLIWLI